MTPEDYARFREKYPKFNEPWTPDEESVLTELARSGQSQEEMAARLLRSPRAVRYKLQSMGLYTPKPAPQPWLPEDDEALIRMYSDGKAFDEMAAHFGRSPQAVVSRLVRLRVRLFPGAQ